MAIVTLTLANSFLLMVASELFFSLANASQSGAGSAFLFEATNANSRMDRKNGAYALILSKMTGTQSIIRITVRLIAPVLFSINPLIPFVISIFVYFLGLLVTLEFKENDISPNRGSICLPEEDGFIGSRTSKLNLKEAVQTFFQELIKIVKTNIFISLCIVSAISLILVSNYSQFIAPNLTSMGFDIKFLGIVTAAASLGEFFGSRLTAKIVKTLKDSYKKSAGELRLKKWCKAISLLPSSLHYATSLQALKSLSITCKRWSIVSCVHDSLLGHSSKRRERLSMKCVATNHSSF